MDTPDVGPGRTLLAESPWDWMLLREAGGDLVLSVLCGSVGMFEVEVVLDRETREAYERHGVSVLRRLAELVQYRPWDYMKPG